MVSLKAPHMTIAGRVIDAGIATLTVVPPDLVEVRYHSGIVFSPENVGVVQAKRRELMGTRPHATLTFIPENVDFELETMRQDHGRGDRTESQLLATAVVVGSSMLDMLTKLYFSYFPPLHRVLVTDNEAEARAWLKERMAGIAGTGS